MRKGAVIALIIILVCVAGGIIGFVAYSNMNSPDSGQTQKQSSGIGLDIEGNEAQDISYGKSITMPGWTEISLPANSTSAVVDFYNPAANDGFCYIKYTLKLKDTGEVLCETGLVEPGSHKRNITLTRALAPGTYKAVLSMQPYTMDENRTELNSASVELDLVVS